MHSLGRAPPFCKTLDSAYGFGLKELVVLPERIYQENLLDKIQDLLTLVLGPYETKLTVIGAEEYWDLIVHVLISTAGAKEQA